jgi:type IV secretion system protein VirD4
MSGKHWLIGSLCVLATGVWTVVASQLFLFACGLWGQIGDPITQATAWWIYAFSPYAADRSIKLTLAATAAAPAILLSLPIILAVRRKRIRRHLTPRLGGGLQPVQRGVTDNHGHARWPTRKEMQKAFGGGEGCLIGASDRSASPRFWFDDLKNGPLHSLLFSGPGGFKTTAAIARLWLYYGPRVVFDPSCEIGPIMTEALERTGHTVKTIGFGDSAIDVLDWIDVRHPEADVHIRTAVDHVYDEGAARQMGAGQAQDPFWSTWGKSLVACLMAHMLYDTQDRYPKTLAVLREGIATPENEMQSMLQGIHANSNSRMARDIAGGLMGMKAPETFTGIYSNAFSATEWLSVQSYADMVSGPGLKTSDILCDDHVVFVQTPLRSLLATPAIGRVVMGALFNALFHADGDQVCNRVLFEIDEAWILGKLNEIELFYTTARKYRGIIQTLWQSEGQMEAIWGKDKAKMLRDSSSWRAYGAVQDDSVAESLSRAIGEHGVMAISEGSNKGRQFGGNSWGSSSRGDNSSMHEIKRRLIKADEITRADPDELFVLFRGFPNPIRCYAAPYFRYPDVAAQMSESRFVRAAAE